MELQTKFYEFDQYFKLVFKRPFTKQYKNYSTFIETWYFPTKWKQTIVWPPFKKVDLELKLANYRLVSNVLFLYKLIKKSFLNVHKYKHSQLL